MYNEELGPNQPKGIVTFSFEVICQFVHHDHSVYTTIAIRIATLEARLTPYTCCTTVRSLWDVECNILNLLGQTASSYTTWNSEKGFLKLCANLH